MSLRNYSLTHYVFVNMSLGRHMDLFVEKRPVSIVLPLAYAVTVSVRITVRIRVRFSDRLDVK